MDHRANPVTTPATSQRRGVALERPARRGWFHPSTWFILLLAALELTWLAWFLVVPLPNFPQESGTMRRGFLLLKAFPEVVPGTTFRESLIGQAAGELSHVENLPERFPIVGAAALIVLAALGLGELILAGLRLRDAMRPGERLALDFGIGTTALGVLTLLAGRAGLLDPWIFRIGLGVIAMAGLGVSRLWRVSWTGAGLGIDSLLPIVLIAPFLIIMLLGAMLPAIDFDVLEYHLQGPKEYFQAGRIAFLPHNVYTSMPFGVEMLHLDGHGGARRLVVGRAGRAVSRRPLRSAGSSADRRGDLARGNPARGLAGGYHLPFHALDLPDGRDRLCRRPALFLPRRLDLGRVSGLDEDSA